MLKGLLLGVVLTLLVLGLVRWWGDGPFSPGSGSGAAPPAAATAPRAELSEEQVKAMFHNRGCTNCHDMTGPLVGPPIVAIAERYRDQPGAVQQLMRSVREGSQGTWGDTPMPMQPVQRVDDEDLEELLRWVLEQ